MLPYTPLHLLLFDGAAYESLVMTSGNMTEEPIVSRNEEAWPRLKELADHSFVRNRAFHHQHERVELATLPSIEELWRSASLPLD